MVPERCALYLARSRIIAILPIEIALLSFDLVLSPSELMAEQLRRCGIRDVTVQPLGVDLEAFHPDKRKPDTRQRLGIDAEQFHRIGR